MKMNIEWKIIARAKKEAIELRDECDGSYIGGKSTVYATINGVDIELIVNAFWEKSFWFEYVAKGDGEEFSGSYYFL